MVITVPLFVAMIPMENDFSASALERIRTGTLSRTNSGVEFLQSFPSLLDRIERILTNDFSIPEELRANMLEMVRYNVLGGKMIRGLFSVYSAYAMSREWDDKMKEQFAVWIGVQGVGAFCRDGAPSCSRQPF